MRDIDYYFMEKSAGKSPNIPTQEMPPKMMKFINALKDSHLSGRFEVGSIVLSLDDVGRNEFQKGLDILDSGLSSGKQRAIRMPFIPEAYGLSITYFDNTQWQQELKRSAVQMKISHCERWLVVQLSNENPYKISKIEVVLPNRFSDAELDAIDCILKRRRIVLLLLKERKEMINVLADQGKSIKMPWR